MADILNNIVNAINAYLPDHIRIFLLGGEIVDLTAFKKERANKPELRE